MLPAVQAARYFGSVVQAAPQITQERDTGQDPRGWIERHPRGQLDSRIVQFVAVLVLGAGSVHVVGVLNGSECGFGDKVRRVLVGETTLRDAPVLRGRGHGAVRVGMLPRRSPTVAGLVAPKGPAAQVAVVIPHGHGDRDPGTLSRGGKTLETSAHAHLQLRALLLSHEDCQALDVAAKAAALNLDLGAASAAPEKGLDGSDLHGKGWDREGIQSQPAPAAAAVVVHVDAELFTPVRGKLRSFPRIADPEAPRPDGFLQHAPAVAEARESDP